MFLDVICSIFDLALWIIFYEGTLQKRKAEIPLPFYAAAYLLAEILLLIFTIIFSTNYSDYRVLFNTILSFLLSLVLTFLYDSTLLHRLMIALAFTGIGLLSEILIYHIVMLLPEHVSEAFISYQAYGAITAKLLSLILCSLVICFYRIKRNQCSIQYNALLLIMPILSLLLLVTIPIRVGLTPLQLRLSLIGITAILLSNVANYYLLNNILHVQQLKEQENYLSQQISSQISKYQQISQTYKQSRSFIHDIKKQYFYMQQCIGKQSYSELDAFLATAVQNLDATAAKVNTGNLVIDSFISSYMDTAENDGIRFDTKLQIELSRIPIADYDLCLVLGNLLDNSYQACHEMPISFSRHILVEIKTTRLEFVIHVCNSYIETNKKRDSNLEHGYGLLNIQRIVSKYDGVYTQKTSLDSYQSIISIPIKEL